MTGGRISHLAAALLGAAALTLGACGGDDEPTDQPGPTAETQTETGGQGPADGKTETARRIRRPKRGESLGSDGHSQQFEDKQGESPEDQPGGAGDEVAARAQASITGDGGKLTPRRVQVPPFIAIRVELRSIDGKPYRLSGGGKELATGGAISVVSERFAGLRPGKRLVLKGRAGQVVIVPSAEPGP